MIRAGQLRAYAASVMPEDNVTANVGGPVDLTTSIDFFDMIAVDGLLVVSSNNGDTASLQVFGRLGGGIISNEVVALTGQTPVPTTQNAWERLMKVLKGSSTAGDVAIEQITAVLTGTVVSVTGDQVALDSAASAVDNAYNGLVFRVTGGLGAGSIAKVIDYDGILKIATIDKVLVLDGTSLYRLSAGVVMLKAPQEIMAVRRPFYNAIAAPPSGVDRTYYEKFFWRNESAEILQAPSVKEIANPTGKIQFAVDPILNGSSVTANRLTLPVTPQLTFGRFPQAMPPTSPDLASGQAVGVWLSFFVPAGQSPIKSSYLSGISGQTT